MQSAVDRVLKALSDGHMICGFVDIPADKSGFNRAITIQLFGFKVADMGYQLVVEKYYSGAFDGELAKKYRKFDSTDDLALYVQQNYSISLSTLTIHAIHVKSSFEVNRPE